MTGDRQGPADCYGLRLKMRLADFTPSGGTNGSVLPSSDIPAWTLLGGAYASCDGDLLTIDTTADSSAFCTFSRSDVDIDFDAGVSFEIRARVDVSGGAGDARCTLFDIRDGTQDERVCCYVSTDMIGVLGSQMKYVGVDSTSMRVYRLTVSGQQWKLFVDDEFVLTGTVVSDIGNDNIAFGDGTATVDKNCSMTIDYFRYSTAGAVDNYNSVRVRADSIVVGNTGLSDIDDTVSLSSDLDSGSAATGTWYRLCIGKDGECFLSVSSVNAQDSRQLAWLRSDSSVATDFLGGRWAGNEFFYYSMYTIFSVAVTNVRSVDCRDYMPPETTLVHMYLYASGTDCALYFYLGNWAPIIYYNTSVIRTLAVIQTNSDRFISTSASATVSSANYQIFGYIQEAL